MQGTKLWGTYLMCDGFIRHLNAVGKEQPGTIINVSSRAAFMEAPQRSSYSLSKIAMVKLAQCIHAGTICVLLPKVYNG
jgi:NAD(P)-dependent dehydrogenase (short-subunit alcohol dehydrogenase family)